MSNGAPYEFKALGRIYSNPLRAWQRGFVEASLGQDADRNPSTAAGILGTFLGYEAIPEIYRRGIPHVSNKKFAYTEFSFNSLIDTCNKLAGEVIKERGGKLVSEEGREILIIPIEVPKPPEKLEQWD